MTSHHTRLAQYSGSFYPNNPDTLTLQLNYLLDHPSVQYTDTIKAAIIPHAGYDYSGLVAGKVYAALRHTIKPKRIAILAPNHQTSTLNTSICDYAYFQTPLGKTPLDQQFIQRHFTNLDYLVHDNVLHEREYSIEVQLPFIHYCFPDTPIIPVIIGNSTDAVIDTIIQLLWEDEQTFIIISSDLYHYYPRLASIQSGLTIGRMIKKNHVNALTHELACGATALKGIMRFASQDDYYWHTVDIQHSSQNNRFNLENNVGYGGFLLFKTTTHLKKP